MKRREFLARSRCMAAGRKSAARRQRRSSTFTSTPVTGGGTMTIWCRHQRMLGVTKTVLLPAGSRYGLEGRLLW
jgi:hypothetical protein